MTLKRQFASSQKTISDSQKTIEMIQISFTALHGDDYVLQIGAAEQGADPTVVDGTRDVFTTTEDDDTDMFMPVRCTSGTVKFYNAGNVWSTLANVSDNHTPVVLKQGGNDVWKGYINKGYVGGRMLFGYNEKCDIAVQCPLSELETVDYVPTAGNNAMIKLEDIIDDIFTNPFGSGTSIVYTPIDDIQVGIMLACYVSSGFFYKTFEDSDGVVSNVPKFTRKKALEEVLKMACCSARWNGTSVDIIAMKPETSTTGISALQPDPADTQSSETAIVPFKNVRVTANADGNETAVDFPTSPLQNWARLYAGNAEQRTIQGAGLLNIHAVGLIWGRIGASFGNPDEWRGIDDDKYTYDTTDLGGNLLITAYQELTDNVQYSGYNLSPAIWLNYTQDYDITPHSNIIATTVSIETKTPFFIQDSILEIQMRVKEDFYESNVNGVILIRVSIGNYYFDYLSNSWVDVTSPGVQMPDFIKATLENGSLKRTGNLDYNFETFSGLGIPVNNVLSGLLKIEIKAHSDFDNHIITIDSFRINAVRHVQDIREKNIFTANGANGNGDDEVNISFCSNRRNANADNFLFSQLSGEYIVVTNMIFGTGEPIRPEQWIANRRAALNTGNVRSVITLRQVGNLAAGKYTYNNKIYDTLSISHDWAENITEAHLIEIS